MSEVSDVLMTIDQALARAKRAKKRLGTAPEEHNAQLALSDATKALQRARHQLQTDTFFDGDELRLV